MSKVVYSSTIGGPWHGVTVNNTRRKTNVKKG
jgi:hypothetical protein